MCVTVPTMERRSRSRSKSRRICSTDSISVAAEERTLRYRAALAAVEEEICCGWSKSLVIPSL
jgi:hypothetical protein